MNKHQRLAKEQEETFALLRASVRHYHLCLQQRLLAADDITPLLQATALLPLSHLDDCERLLRYEYYGWNRQEIAPTPFLTWIDLCSGDGRRRERTLRTLSGPAPNAFCMALALRRLNDWVPQVRAAARQQLPALAAVSEPEQVAEVLAVMLLHWASWQRMDDEDRRVLLQIVAQPAIARCLQQRIKSRAAGPQATLLTQVARTPVLDDALLDFALHAVQPAVRARAFQAWLSGKMRWFEERIRVWKDVRYCVEAMQPVFAERPLSVTPASWLPTLQQAMIDRSTIVRRVAADQLIRQWPHLGEQAAILAQQLAADRATSVAERGQFVLRKLSENSQ